MECSWNGSVGQDARMLEQNGGMCCGKARGGGGEEGSSVVYTPLGPAVA